MPTCCEYSSLLLWLALLASNAHRDVQVTLLRLSTRSLLACSVVGFTGRKGPKEDPTILGSSADFSLRGARMPCCIVKRKVAPRESHLFVVAVDGSERAHSGLQLAEQLAMPGDRIAIVHVVVSGCVVSIFGCCLRMRTALMSHWCGRWHMLHLFNLIAAELRASALAL